ncbi:hypothetical protein Pyn_02412 [Prunus yedoensis var. nudiflora]|uniref:Uncharacterized protein n=1 Tax=Prunus yedoensis var. nudiflora TaxID=2094558 RepID=A0A314Y976_PRUYE|nr:hypothetical protein Pyn_02412 [Prunus yedoensis var. nudiflora]
MKLAGLSLEMEASMLQKLCSILPNGVRIRHRRDWENPNYCWLASQVTACARCNSKKGQKTLEEANMKLTKVPKAPKDYDILAIPLTSAAIKMLKMRKGTPEEWLQYLSKPSSEP